MNRKQDPALFIQLLKETMGLIAFPSHTGTPGKAWFGVCGQMQCSSRKGEKSNHEASHASLYVSAEKSKSPVVI